MVEDITPAALKDRLDRGEDVEVVDIRPPEAFERGHVPGAVNVPFAELAQAIDTREWGDDVVVVCPIGESSLQAARLLESYEGVADDARICNLDGGYEAWDYELETDGDET